MPAIGKIQPTPIQVGSKGGEHKEIDENLSNGPLENRSCRDVACCIVFLLFLGGVFGVAGYAVQNGNPSIIGRGYDADGKMCGVSPGYENYTYLYFANPIKPYINQTLCVAECPASPSIPILKCKTNSVYLTCLNTTASGNSYIHYPKSGDIYYYSSVSFLKRMCVPTVAASVAHDAVKTILNAGILEQWVSDIQTCAKVIAWSVGVAFIIGLIYTVVLKYCSGILTWLAIISFIVFTAVLGWRFFQHAKDLQKELSDTAGTSDKSSNVEKTIKADKIIAYICWGIAAFAVLMTLCLYQRIKLAIAILKAAADFVRNNVLVFLVPIVSVIVLAAYFAFWAVVIVYLVSCGDPEKIASYPFGSFTFDRKLQRLIIYHLFGLLWFSAFVVAASQFIISSSVCIWYFAQGTGFGPTANISKSVWRFFRYHFGSIAFGSLIVAVVQFIRIVVAYMEAQMKKAGGDKNRFTEFLFKCAQCCLACFEKFIKFINKNAYIQIALSGKSFCFAAKDGFLLASGNPLRYSVLNGIAGVFVWFGKVFISSLTALSAYLVITKWKEISSQLYSPIIPTLIVLVFAFAIAGVFMTIYGMAADAILGCFVLDEELNKKKNAPPRHCPESLIPFLNMNKKKD